MHLQPPIRALYYQYSFLPFPDKKIGRFSTNSGPPLSTPASPLSGRYIINIFFPPISRQKNRSPFDQLRPPLSTPASPPYQGVILSIYFFHLFPDKKIGRFSTVFACPYFTVTARGCQSLVPCFSLISWSCTRILFFLSTTALGCAFNVLLHACTVAPNAVTAFIIRCHRSHVNPFTRPKNDFFV